LDHNGGRGILLLGTLVFDIDPSIMPDWAKDSTLI
jgi:hypothetical protein